MPVSGYYLTQVDRLQTSVDRMGRLAGRLVGDAIAAVVAKDTTLAHDVVERDNELDRLDDEHEEQIIQIIARNQPVARDLRFLMALLRTNTNIERVGDIAVNIAQAALRLSDKPPIEPSINRARPPLLRTSSGNVG